MDNYFTIFVILTLVAVIIIQAVERYFHIEQLQRENSKLIAAVLSKNMGEYTHAVRVEKEVRIPQEVNPDEIPLDSASDKVFDEFIKAQNE